MPTVTVPLISPEAQQKQLAEGKINIILPNGQVITPSQQALVQEAYRRGDSQGQAQAAASGSPSGGGVPAAPAPKYEEEIKPLNSMTKDQAEKEGYEYSGAVGYHRIPATAANIAIAKNELAAQREELSRIQNREQAAAPDTNKIYYVGDKEVSRGEYLNSLASAQTNLYAEGERLDFLRTNLSQNNLENATMNSNVNTPLLNASMPDNSSLLLKKVEDVQKHQEELSPIGRASLRASEFYMQQGEHFADAGTSRITNENVKWLVQGAYYGIFNAAAGLSGIPAFLEGMIRHPSDIGTLSEFGVEGAKQAYTENPKKFILQNIGQMIGTAGLVKASTSLRASASATKGFSVSDVVAKTPEKTMTRGGAVYETKTALGPSVKSSAEFETLTLKLPEKVMTSYGDVEAISAETGRIYINEKSVFDRLFRRPGKITETKYQGESTVTRPSKVSTTDQEGFVVPKGTRAGRFAIKTEEGQTVKGAFISKEFMRKGRISVSDSMYKTGSRSVGKSRGVVRDLPPPKEGNNPYEYFKSNVKTKETGTTSPTASLAKVLHDEIVNPAFPASSSPNILTSSTELGATMHSPLRFEAKQKKATQGSRVVSIMPENMVQMPDFTKQKQQHGKALGKDKQDDNPEKFFKVISKQSQQQKLVKQQAQDQLVSDRMLRMPTDISRVPQQKRVESPLYIPEQFMKTFETQKPAQRQRFKLETGNTQRTLPRFRNPPDFTTGVRPSDILPKFFDKRSSGQTSEFSGKSRRGSSRKKYWEIINPVGDILDIDVLHGRRGRR